MSLHPHFFVDEFNVKKIVKERNSKKTATAYHQQIARKLQMVLTKRIFKALVCFIYIIHTGKLILIVCEQVICS